MLGSQQAPHNCWLLPLIGWARWDEGRVESEGFGKDFPAQGPRWAKCEALRKGLEQGGRQLSPHVPSPAQQNREDTGIWSGSLLRGQTSCRAGLALGDGQSTASMGAGPVFSHLQTVEKTPASPVQSHVTLIRSLTA